MDCLPAHGNGSFGSFSLTAGSHSLTIAYREDGAQLDKISVSDSSLAPTGTGNQLRFFVLSDPWSCPVEAGNGDLPGDAARRRFAWRPAGRESAVTALPRFAEPLQWTASAALSAVFSARASRERLADFSQAFQYRQAFHASLK